MLDLRTLRDLSRAKWLETGNTRYLDLCWLLRHAMYGTNPVERLKEILDSSEQCFREELHKTAQEFGYLI